MVLHDDVHVRTHLLAHGGNAVAHEVHEARAQKARGVLVAEAVPVHLIEGEEVDLDGVVTLVDRLTGVAAVVLKGDGRRLPVIPAELQLARIAAQLVAHLATQ